MDPQDVSTIQNQQDDQITSLQQPAKPGAAFGKGPEGGFPLPVESAPVSEITKGNEIQKAPETEPAAEEQETFVPLAKVIKKDEPAAVQPVGTSATQAQKPNIVDKTDLPSTLHHIQHPHDKITDLADREEEEFIKDVKAAHGHDHEHK